MEDCQWEQRRPSLQRHWPPPMIHVLENTQLGRMLKRVAILLSFIVATAFLWRLIPAHPSVDAIAEVASINVSRGAEILSFERIIDGREPQFIVSLSVPEGGAAFCKTNNLTENSLAFEPLSPGDKGYDLFSGSPGICYGVRELGHGGVYIVVRRSAVVIYVDHR